MYAGAGGGELVGVGGTRCFCLAATRVPEPPVELGTGDTVYFRADVPHAYQNPGKKETVMFLVMTYGEPPEQIVK